MSSATTSDGVSSLWLATLGAKNVSVSVTRPGSRLTSPALTVGCSIESASVTREGNSVTLPGVTVGW